MFSLVDYARLFFGRLARVTIIVARKENHLKSNINNRINIFFKEKKKRMEYFTDNPMTEALTLTAPVLA